MRWDGLFADLEAQLAEHQRSDRAAEVDERTRGEVATLRAADRLRAGLDQPVVLRLSAHGSLSGTLRRVGPDWLLLDEGPDREVLVVLGEVLGVRGLARFAASSDSGGVVESRLGLRHALRGMARDRASVRLLLRDADIIDATIDRVGSDFIEVAVHAPGEARRRDQVRHAELILLHALVAIRRAGS